MPIYQNSSKCVLKIVSRLEYFYTELLLFRLCFCDIPNCVRIVYT